MARTASPWFWEERQGWYVNKDGQRHFLGEHPVDSPSPKKARGKWNVPLPILQAFHELMAKAPKEPSAPEVDGLTIAEVFDKFLSWCKKHREPRTYDWYHDHLQGFMNHVGGELLRHPASALRPFHVIEWVDSHGEDWSPAYRRGAIMSVQRAFNLAEELGYIDASPVKRIKKPQPQRREKLVRPHEWEKIRDHYKPDDPFRILLEFSWETGCRPQESRCIEPRHIELENHRVVFAPAEAKGKKYHRIIRLTPRAEEILRQQMAGRPDGPVFRNEDGNPWTPYAIGCRFGRLKKHIGVRYAAYDLRHGFCQDLLENTGDPLATAELMGHRDPTMVSRVYSHMNQADSHLDRVLRRRTKSQDGMER
ncbi:MAG: tyrosine-type recombinase/integrase [Gemmataceae bacterium]